MDNYRRLYKSDANKMLCGVCGGIGEFFGFDPTLVRVAYVFLTIFSAAFPGILMYIILAIIMPKVYNQQGNYNQQPPYNQQGNYNQQPPRYQN